MRAIIIVAVFIAGTSAACAQHMKEAQVPEAVKNAFKAKFPDVTDADWEKEGNDYEVEFEAKRVNMDHGKSVKETCERSALFSANGTWLQTEEEIKVDQLPAAVSEYITKNLAGKKIKEAAKITDAEGKITYEAEVAKTDYIFDAKGNFLKKEEESEKDNDDKKKD